MGVGLCLWRVVGWVYRGWCGEMCVGLSGGGCWIFGGPQGFSGVGWRWVLEDGGLEGGVVGGDAVVSLTCM